jgi:hypothetical protein
VDLVVTVVMEEQTVHQETTLHLLDLLNMMMMDNDILKIQVAPGKNVTVYYELNTRIKYFSTKRMGNLPFLLSDFSSPVFYTKIHLPAR